MGHVQKKHELCSITRRVVFLLDQDPYMLVHSSYSVLVKHDSSFRDSGCRSSQLTFSDRIMPLSGCSISAAYVCLAGLVAWLHGLQSG